MLGAADTSGNWTHVSIVIGSIDDIRKYIISGLPKNPHAIST